MSSSTNQFWSFLQFSSIGGNDDDASANMVPEENEGGGGGGGGGGARVNNGSPLSSISLVSTSLIIPRIGERAQSIQLR